jgi:transcriptional regulator with XRE-family HTH domain
MPLDLKAICALMAERGLNQTTLARLANTSHQRIHEIVHGHRINNIELPVLERLAAALGVGVEAILRK